MKSPIALRFAFVCAAGLVLTPAFADPAPAPPTKAQRDEAQRRYQRGRELYEENDFAAALVEIRRAYDIIHSYKLLYDIGQICFQLQDYPCALKSFTRYLEDGKDELPASRKTEVQTDVERLKGRVATLRITTSKPGAEIFVDDVLVGQTPIEGGVIVGAGKRKVTARLEGSTPVSKILEVAGTDSLDVALDLGAATTTGTTTPGPVPAPAPSATAPDSGGRSVPIAPWVVTGVLAAGAGVMSGVALGASSDYRKKLDTFGSTRSDLDAANGSMRALAITADVLWGAAAVAGVTSIILTATAGPSPKKAAALPVNVSVGPGSVWIKGSF